jgi:hypothetical protein
MLQINLKTQSTDSSNTVMSHNALNFTSLMVPLNISKHRFSVSFVKRLTGGASEGKYIGGFD